MDWGMLGYFIGEVVRRHSGTDGRCSPGGRSQPQTFRRRRGVLGRSGDVSHAGVTPEAATLEMALGGREARWYTAIWHRRNAGALRKAECANGRIRMSIT